MNNQEAKHDLGKPHLTYVPRKIIWDIARIRDFGNAKYGSPENWRQVSPERYRDAAFRHFLCYLDEPAGVDPESGLPHLWHLACNIAFLCEMEGGTTVRERSGKWLTLGEECVCSACGWRSEEYIEYKYCPECGAEMEGRKE